MNKFKSYEIPEQTWGNGYKIQTLAKKPFAIDYCWVRENQFSSVTGILTTLHGRPQVQEQLNNANVLCVYAFVVVLMVQ